MAYGTDNKDGSWTSPGGKTYSAEYMDRQRKKAQQYAQAALEGKGSYVSPSQMANAVSNAYPASITHNGGNYTVQNSAYSAYMAELERQRAERQRMLDEQYNQGKQNIRDTARASNKQAYIAYMQGLKNMPQAAAMYGSGGMAQSLANKSQLNYENNRKDIEKAKISALGELESDYRSGMMNGQEQYLAALKNAPAEYKTYSGPVYTSTLGDKTLYKGGNKEQSIDALTSQLLSMGYTRAQVTDYLKSQGIWGEK